MIVIRKFGEYSRLVPADEFSFSNEIDIYANKVATMSLVQNKMEVRNQFAYAYAVIGFLDFARNDNNFCYIAYYLQLTSQLANSLTRCL
jgi:hypothetical protein